MSRAITEDQLRALEVVDIKSMPHWMGALNRQDLCMHRGIDLSDVVAGNSYFVDSDLGYLIAHRNFVAQFKAGLHGFSRGLDDDDIYTNWRAKLADDPPRVEYKEVETPWYVERAGGWPSQRGSCIRVGIIDDGTSARLLRRGAADFGACDEIDGTPWSMRDHGEECAQAIAEPDSDGKRWSPAPDCRLISGQARRMNHETYMWFIDLLLMLSWTVGCRGAQIVNLSFNLETGEIDQTKRQRLLSRIACDLRERNRALLFASTDPVGKVVGFPAQLDGFIAVNSYTVNTNNDIEAHIGGDPGWVAKIDAQELLFAPYGICLPNRQVFPETSGSCAYASGVAALYCEQYLDQPKQSGGSYTLNDIRLMLGEDLPPIRGQARGPTLRAVKLRP